MDEKAKRRKGVREGLIYRDATLHEDDCKVLQKRKEYVTVYWLKLKRVTRVSWSVFDRFKQVGDMDSKCPQSQAWLKRLEDKDE